MRTGADERDGQFSPNGKFVAYQSNESGRFEIYVQLFPGSATKQQISTSGGAQVRWRRDGHELFYIGLDGRLMSVPIRFSANGTTLEPGVASALFLTSVGDSGQDGRQQYMVSTDGQRFLMNTINQQARAAPIMVILNYKLK
jgi:eukaryotic-like serine/threonine-protein kinase